MKWLIDFFAELIQQFTKDTYTPPELHPENVVKPKVSLLPKWAEAHEIFESGGDKNAFSLRMNNPGNLKSVAGEFIYFPTYKAGHEALCNYLIRAATNQHQAYVKKAAQLKLKSTGELTILQFIEVYTSGDSAEIQRNYATFIASHCNVPFNTQIKFLL